MRADFEVKWLNCQNGPLPLGKEIPQESKNDDQQGDGNHKITQFTIRNKGFPVFTNGQVIQLFDLRVIGLFDAKIEDRAGLFGFIQALKPDLIQFQQRLKIVGLFSPVEVIDMVLVTFRVIPEIGKINRGEILGHIR